MVPSQRSITSPSRVDVDGVQDSCVALFRVLVYLVIHDSG